MKQNLGTLDRTLRVLFALAVAWLYASERIGGALGIGLAVVAGVLLLTSLTARCPLYVPFRCSTRRGGA